MSASGSNLPMVADFNQTVVLDTVRRTPGGISRADLARATGLAPQTVTNISRRLLVEGLVRESAPVRTGRGRPAALLTVRPEGRYAVGVHLDPAVMTVVRLDLSGAVVARHQRPTPEDPVRATEAIVAGVAAVLEDVPRELVLGVGIATPGPLDLDAGTVLDPPLLPGWHGVPLRAAVAAGTGLPVRLEKDVLAAAAAHVWRPEHPSGDFAFIYLGSGVALAVVLGGEVVRGPRGNAGHSGHLVVDPDGAPCWCGKRGCMGRVLDARAVLDLAVETGALAAADVRVLDLGEVFDAVRGLGRDATAGPAARAVLERIGARVAMAATVVADLLSLDAVVIGGPLWAPLQELALPAAVAEAARYPAQTDAERPTLSSSPYGLDVAAIGAGAAVLGEVFAPRPSALLLGSDPPAGRA